MFTLEESALLGRMLRCVGWLSLCTLLATAGYVAYRVIEYPRAVAAHPHRAPLQAHPHHS